jgi:hypothetical protein
MITNGACMNVWQSSFSLISSREMPLRVQPQVERKTEQWARNKEKEGYVF